MDEKAVKPKKGESEKIVDRTQGNKSVNLTLDTQAVGNLNLDLQLVKKDIKAEN